MSIFCGGVLAWDFFDEERVLAVFFPMIFFEDEFFLSDLVAASNGAA